MRGGPHSLNSVNEEVITEHERETGVVNLPTIPQHLNLPTRSLTHCPHKHTSFLLPCLSASPQQPQRLKNAVTSQTCQINHTCCNVIIYIIILIRKLVTQGQNHQRQGGAGRGTMGAL